MIITHNSTESPVVVIRKPEVDFDILVESRFLRAYLDGRVQQRKTDEVIFSRALVKLTSKCLFKMDATKYKRFSWVGAEKTMEDKLVEKVVKMQGSETEAVLEESTAIVSSEKKGKKKRKKRKTASKKTTSKKTVAVDVEGKRYPYPRGAEDALSEETSAGQGYKKGDRYILTKSLPIRGVLAKPGCVYEVTAVGLTYEKTEDGSAVGSRTLPFAKFVKIRGEGPDIFHISGRTDSMEKI